MSVLSSAHVVTDGLPVNRSEQGRLPGNVRELDQAIFNTRSESDWLRYFFNKSST